MRMLLATLIVCVGLASTGLASAQPRALKPNPRQIYTQATQAFDGGDYARARELVDQGLAAAPKDLKLLGLKGAVLVKLYDYTGALAVYRAYVKAAPRGQARLDAQQLVDDLLAVESTSLEVTLANGPADVFLDARTSGVFCNAAPSCSRKLLPRTYTVSVERPGFLPWTERVTVERGQAASLAVTLVEKPSPLTVRVPRPGARITVDGADYDPAAPIPPGPHKIVVSLKGYAEERRDIVAREGAPIVLEIPLTPIVPIRVEPATAEILLGDRPIEARDGGLAIPPGPHVLVVRAPGYQEQRIEIPEDRPPTYELDVALAQLRGTSEADESSASGGLTRQRKIALAVGGLGLAAAATGVVLQVRTIEDDGSLEAAQQRRSRALRSQIAFGAAGLAAAIAIGLWIDGAPGPQAAVTARVGAVNGIDFVVRF
jgi:hypothetical protein